MTAGMSQEVHDSRLAFPEALRFLLELRRMSYRGLATRTRLSAGYLNHLACGTRAVPSDQVIKILARALKVKPDYFLEYRQRGVLKQLGRSPEVVDMLYGFLVNGDPLPRDFQQQLEAARKSK